jgi:thioredoxin reductase (NADPH)
MKMPECVDGECRVRLFGKLSNSNGYMIRDFLHRSDVPFEWVELTSDEDARVQAGVDHLHDSRLPVCVFPDGSRLECPTLRQITEKLGWFHDPSRAEYDLAIYGAGPAGLSAAVYGASEGLTTVIIERSAVGGQAGSTSKIENYLGFAQGISGADLAEQARTQACRFGAEFLISRAGVRGEFVPGKGTGYLEDGTHITARATICATGVEYRRLELPNEERLRGSGVYYGAGASEADLCKDRDVFIVGGGNSAGQAAMYFSRSAKHVTMVVRGVCLKETLSSYLLDRIRAAPNITVLHDSEIVALDGDDTLRQMTIENHKTGERTVHEACWLFVCIGGEPNTRWAEEVGIQRDASGYLITGPDLAQNGGLKPVNWPLDRNPYYLETSMPGVFAAGDVRHGSVKRCASAVGEGAMAVTFVHRYLAGG